MRKFARSKNREVKFIRSLQACAENDNEKEKCGNLAALFLTVWILREHKTAIRLADSDYIVASRPAGNSVSQSAS